MLKRTPFYDIHQQAGAKLIDFGGFEMPVQYESIKKEHNAVREQAGMFDVSHMGEFLVEGPEALDLIQHVTVNDASKLKPGKAQYSVMCYEDGGIVDDILVYMLEENRYMLVTNAANTEKDSSWIDRHNSFDATLENRSDAYCLLAVQGPDCVKTLQKLTDVSLSDIGFYTFKTGTFGGFEDIMLSATGYTGEKGFELYFRTSDTDPVSIWEQIMEAGAEFGIQPCGLGARDTLRLEMGFALYGNDITKETNPLEGRLGWLVKWDKGTFIGREALVRIKEDGTDRKLIGFTVDDRRSIPRPGYAITNERGDEIGYVTSGTRSITLGRNIGMGYVTKDYAAEGTKIHIHIRTKQAEARVVKPPFVK